MLIAIVGTPSAGKRTVLQYLIDKHGFTEVGLQHPADPMEGSELVCPPSIPG
jgi:broad-specificity NMP kinase